MNNTLLESRMMRKYHVRFGGGYSEKCGLPQLAGCLPYYLPSGQAVANLSVAANRRWNDPATGQPQEEVCWFRVSVWGKQAEAANQYLSKGRQVLIEGRLRPDPETGGPRVYARSDGTAGASFEVVADRVQFLGSNSNGANGNGQGEAEPDYDADSIPF